MDAIAWFLIVSAAIYFVIEGLKKLKWIGPKAWFNDILPVVPMVLGIIAGLLVGPSIIDGMSLPASAIVGLLAGGLSANSYTVVKRILERRGEALAEVDPDN